MNQPIYNLRPATEADNDFLYHLHISTIREAVEATWGWDEAFQADHFRRKWNPAKYQIIMLHQTQVGVLVLEEQVEAIFLGLIEISLAYQGQGLGSQVIQDVCALAQEKSLPLELHVLKTNPRAKSLYERLGFKVIEEREERYVMKWT